jgi:predicted nucleic acid-binding Zn ribbon protein
MATRSRATGARDARAFLHSASRRGGRYSCWRPRCDAFDPAGGSTCELRSRRRRTGRASLPGRVQAAVHGQHTAAARPSLAALYATPDRSDAGSRYCVGHRRLRRCASRLETAFRGSGFSRDAFRSAARRSQESIRSATVRKARSPARAGLLVRMRFRERRSISSKPCRTRCRRVAPPLPWSTPSSTRGNARRSPSRRPR